MARFESVAHRYVDLSEKDYGIALLNNGKYGHKVLGNVIDLNLLRSPSYPDPDADSGHHEFTYSLLPHAEELEKSDVHEAAVQLNSPPLVTIGEPRIEQLAPLTIQSESVFLEVVKKAEKEDALIIRLVERKGRRSQALLYFIGKNGELTETNLIEWENTHTWVCDNPIRLEFRPFEIRTFRYKSQE